MEIKALIEAAAQGDQRAWRALTRRIEPKLRRWFASKYGMFDDDLVQDTLIVVWNKLPDFEMRSEAAFKSWVLKIARFVALAMRRERGYEAKAEQAGALAIARRTPSMGLSSRMDRAEHLDLVEREADKLPESLRLAVNNMLTGGDA